MEIITTHINSDFDGLGAMLAARKLYPDAVCVFPGSQEKTLRQFFLTSSSYATGFERAKNIDPDKVTRLILVDVDQPDRIGKFASLIGKPGVEIHVYDHHPVSDGAIKADVAHIERVGAATTLLVEILRERRIPIEPDEATVMILGIYEDTGGLTFSTTTPRDFFAAGYLLSQGAEITAINDFITPELTADQVALLNELLKSRTVEEVAGVEITLAQASNEEYVGDIAALAHKIRDMENLDVFIMWVRMEDRVHIVARSRLPEVDVSELTRHFGGGGHPEAASATVRDRTPIQLRDEIVGLLPKLVKARVTARELCTSPVKTVDAAVMLTEVRDLLNRYHINAVPVMRGETVVGVLTRIVVEHALQHGLQYARAEEYMSTDFAAVEPSTDLNRIRELIVMGRQRFLPVVEGGRLVGAITRTDLLAAITRMDASEVAAPPKEVQVRHARKTLEELVDPLVVERLRELGVMADEAGMSAYLVGGMVRDLLLRTENLDVDVVVEGDGMRLARAAARKWNATVRIHQAFSTAKLIFEDGFRMDIATARTEYYTEPAALPTVEQSSLKLDLSRRDFTINTLAMRLAPDRFGEVIDFFGGLRDLKERTIRILHNLSFVEDPTRVLRALRFSLRFGFQPGNQTRKLLRSSVRAGFLAQARGPRLFRELQMIFEEANPIEAVELLDRHGALSSFHPRIRLEEKMVRRFESIQEVAAWFQLLYLERPLQVWMLFLLALVEPLSEEELAQWAEAFGIGSREGKQFIEARVGSNKVLAGLREAVVNGRIPDSAIHAICRHHLPETLLFAMARTRDERKRRAISRYYTRLAGARTLLAGSDLKKLGVAQGPVYRELLDGLLTARLDGEVSTRDDEINWVKQRYAATLDGR